MKKEIVEAINASPYKAFLAVTGGGTRFIGDFLEFGGGSATILGFYVPYSQQLFADFIGRAPEQYVSEEAARKLAVASFERAKKLVPFNQAIGIGCTVSLSKGENERAGRQHRFYIAMHKHDMTRTIDGVLTIDRTRAEEERVISELLFNVLADACGLARDYAGVLSGDAVNIRTISDRSTQRLYTHIVNSETPMRGFNSRSSLDLLMASEAVIFPGSFNPVHAGHMEMARIAKELTGIQPIFEISVRNVDKPSLDYFDIMDRHNQFVDFPLVLTNTPRLIDKAKLLLENFTPRNPQKLTFVLGNDTWERFGDPKYDDKEEFCRFTKEYWKRVQFIVFCRDGKLDKNTKGFNVRFIENFNNPISSTQLRKA